jgi:hypothetical protein
MADALPPPVVGPRVAADPTVTVPITVRLRTPRALRHIEDRPLGVKVVYTLALEPVAAANEPLVDELPPPPGIAKPSYPLPFVTTWERVLVSFVALNAAPRP